MIENSLRKVLRLLVESLLLSRKTLQLKVLSLLKTIIYNYLETPELALELLEPNKVLLARYLESNRGSLGVCVSSFLSIWLPKQYKKVL